MSSCPGERVDANVKGVPHDAQKVRVACSEDLKVAGSSDTKRNDATGTLNQATNGAPLVWRQIVQWQAVWLAGPASIS